MVKFFLVFLCSFLIIFVGCAQHSDDTNAINELSVAAEEETQAPGSNESKTADSASVPEDDPTDGETIEIKEKMFILQCNDIYTNPSDYKDKIIKLEGIYQEYTDTKTGKKCDIVYRKTPGCCGADGQAGFQFNYTGKKPGANDWIKVAGKIEVVTDDGGNQNVILNLLELEVSAKRGAEFVNY